MTDITSGFQVLINVKLSFHLLLRLASLTATLRYRVCKQSDIKTQQGQCPKELFLVLNC